MTTRHPSLAGVFLVSCLSGVAVPQDRPDPVGKLTVKQLEDRCRIEIDGTLFTEYVFKGHPNPILYPVHGAFGLPVTRNYPMRSGKSAAKDEAKDHPHHRSLWFAHGSVNGHDFWSGKGRISQDEIVVSGGGNTATITAKNRWMVGDEVICTETRTLVFHIRPGGGRCIDYQVQIHATEGDVVFGDTKEGTMAVRMTPSLRLRGNAVARGKVCNSEGITGKKVWGKRAKWVSYWGPVQGKTVGIAIFDHPKNHGHPCRWHARDYGLVAANPWGIAQFERKKKGTGDATLPRGETLTLRYRFFFHAGDSVKAGVAQEYEKFAKTGR